MSAFIVDADCINSIVTYLNRHSRCFPWLREEFGYDVTQTGELSRLASALHDLNFRAVAQRYGEQRAKGDLEADPPFRFRIVHRHAVAVHKAACCLQYQCTEGDVPEQPLYRALDLIIERIADQIVRALPAYDKAAWGD